MRNTNMAPDNEDLCEKCEKCDWVKTEYEFVGEYTIDYKYWCSCGNSIIKTVIEEPEYDHEAWLEKQDLS